MLCKQYANKYRYKIGSGGGVAWTHSDNDVNLNIRGIIAEAIDANISFNMMLSHCISHEIIHSILKRMVGDLSSQEFDIICYEKNKNFKTWIGGIG